MNGLYKKIGADKNQLFPIQIIEIIYKYFKKSIDKSRGMMYNRIIKEIGNLKKRKENKNESLGCNL
jgi:hypothetical protein